MRALLLSSTAIAATMAPSCSCGDPLVVTDAFATDAERSQEAAEVTHRYASNARVPWQVKSTDPFVDIAEIEIVASDGLSIDDDPAVTIENGVLSASILTSAAGTGTVVFKRGSDVVSSRDVEVVDVAALTVDLTAPATDGITLPELDIERVRIVAGGNAAFRVGLFAAGDGEVFGLEAVDAVAADDSITTAQRTGCGAGGCLGSAMATQVSVADDAELEAPVDVTITGGTGSITMTVVPTSIDDVTQIELDEQALPDAPGGRDENDRTGVIARVSVGDEPLFGAPVEWSVADVAVEGRGDAIRYRYVDGENATVVASIAGATATMQAPTTADDVEVSSVTGACSSVGAAPWFLALAVGLKRRRPARAS